MIYFQQNCYKQNSKKMDPQFFSSKSLSLPRLDNSQKSPVKKPLKEFHKVNWSVTPNCLIQAHAGQPIIYVCVRAECECTTRLVCKKCFYTNHGDHNKSMMAIDEIKVGKIKSMRYWPFNGQFKPIFQFIKSHNSYLQSLIQDVKSTFDNLLQTLTRTVLQTKEKYIAKVQRFYQKQTTKQDYINMLTQSLEKMFNLKPIQNCIKEIFNKETRHEVFMKKIKDIINDATNRQNLEKIKVEFFNPSFDKGKDLKFDKIYFIKKQKIFMKNITDLQNSILEENVEIDEASVGLETIIVQTVQYLKKTSQGLYPLMYQEKQLEDGTFYTGFTFKGNRALLGLRDYRNGFKYYGEWRNNCRNGWGVYENKDSGYKYAGNWRQDKKNGFGKQVTSTFSYQGNFVNDKKQGFGSIIQDGVRFDITWKNDKKHGKGIKFDTNGEIEVYFLNGIESQLKGGQAVLMEGQKRDVNFLARMFAQQNKS